VRNSPALNSFIRTLGGAGERVLKTISRESRLSISLNTRLERLPLIRSYSP